MPRALALATLWIAGCTVPNPHAVGGTDDGGGDAACVTGTEGCPCETAGCDAGLECHAGTCAVPECGDGYLDPGEGCDDGAANADTGACKRDCTPQACGDGHVGPDEGCDDGAMNGEAAACTPVCTTQACGDGYVGAQEGCDLGADNADTGNCKTDCTPQTCGDGFVGPNEECDEGMANADTAACKSNCEAQVCGDAFTGPGEECDDANTDEDDGCRSNCRLTASPTCGDGTIDPGEFCYYDPVDVPSAGGLQVRVVDLEGDGHQDIVFAIDGGTSVITRVRRGNGDGSFGPAEDKGAAGDPTFWGTLQSMIVADLDDDGLFDLVTHHEDSNASPGMTVYRYFATAPGLLGTPSLSPVTGVLSVSPRSSAVARYEPIAAPVVLAADPTSSSIVESDAVGDERIAFATVSPDQLAVADPRGTLVNELVVATDPTRSAVHVLEHDGSTLVLTQTLLNLNDPADVRAGDLDDDGREDVVLQRRQTGCAPCAPPEIVVLRGRNLVEPLEVGATAPLTDDVLVGVGVGDVTNDGFDDVLTVRGDSSEATLNVIEADASGLPFTRSVPLTIADGAEVEIELADFDEDGVDDILVHQPGVYTLRLLLSNP